MGEAAAPAAQRLRPLFDVLWSFGFFAPPIFRTGFPMWSQELARRAKASPARLTEIIC